MRRALLVCTLAVAMLLALGGPAPGSAQEATPEGTPEPAPAVTTPPSVGLTLRDPEGNLVGSATLVESIDDGSVTVTVTGEGMPPGEHGIHVHETGICDPAGDEPFSSAGDHFNPTGASHGGPPPSADAAAAASPIASPAGEAHAGDLGNLTVEEDGTVRFTITTDRFTLSAGDASLQDEDGSALVIHADPDDLTTDPDGNAGARIACGVIFASTVAPVASPAATPAV
ncbi:MAG: superoxide dismutase family protein [Thermomicrobiales bacterium]